MVLNKEIIEKLRRQYGDSFYVLDTEQFKKNFLEIKNTFRDMYPNFNIAYSYKTNYIPKLCKLVNSLGGYAEVVSEMEAELAVKCGVNPNKIIWNGPIKSPENVEKFLFLGVTVNVDSIEEMEHIQRLANIHTDKILNVGIRCNYDVGDEVLSRFGFDVAGDDFKKSLEIITTTDNIKLVNFHCHFAKRQAEYWPMRVNGMLDIIKKYKIIPERIDLGGGIFGKMEESLRNQFPYEIPTYRDYAKALCYCWDYFKGEENIPEILIEPGTAIVGDCMKFVGSVKTIKKVRGKYIASVLASQKNISMTGVNPPIEVIHMGGAKQYYDNLDLVGFTCIEGDVLYKNYSGFLAKEDVIVISNCGSYSIVMKPPFILPNFPVLDICNEGVEVIKRQETFDDVFCTFNF